MPLGSLRQQLLFPQPGASTDAGAAHNISQERSDAQKSEASGSDALDVHYAQQRDGQAAAAANEEADAASINNAAEMSDDALLEAAQLACLPSAPFASFMPAPRRTLFGFC